MRVLTMLLLLSTSGCVPAGAEQAQRLSEAWLWIGAADSAPPRVIGTTEARSGWRSVSLPDVWSRERKLGAREGWYSFDLVLEETPATLQGVYMTRASINHEVYVNGSLVGQGGRLEPPITRNIFNGSYASIPRDLLVPGTNRVDVRLVTSFGSVSLLEPIWVGPDDVLRRVHERQRFFGREVGQLAHLIVILVGMLSLSRELRGRTSRPGMAWLSAGLICFSVGSLPVMFPEIPMPTRFSEWFCWTLVILAVGLGSMGLRRARGRPSRLHDSLALGTPVVAAVSLAAVPYPDFRVALAVLWLPTGVLFLDGFVGATRAIGTGVLTPRTPLAILAIVVVGSPLIDFMSGPPGDLRFRLATANMAVVALCLAWFLFSNTLKTAFEAQRLDAELEAQQARSSLERDRAVSLERDRMVKDMHDGTAGHLVSALSLVRSGEAEPEQLSAILQDALDDLRTTIEALDPAETTLSGMLGVLRGPIERRLRPHGIALDWRIGEIDHITDLDAADAGNLFRLIQEAVGNAIRHAKASRIEIRADPSPGGRDAIVSVSDDGIGGVRARSGGRGLGNMERRARAIGGLLSIESDERGTRVTVDLPAERLARDGSPG